MYHGFHKKVLSSRTVLIDNNKSVTTIDSTVWLHRTGCKKYRFLFLFFLTAWFTSVLVFNNQFLLCVSKLFVSMCFWQCSLFRITDKLLPFDLSILIWDKLCMNYVFIGIFFSFNKLELF